MKDVKGRVPGKEFEKTLKRSPNVNVLSRLMNIILPNYALNVFKKVFGQSQNGLIDVVG